MKTVLPLLSLDETRALFAALSEQVPGVIYQYQLFPDGRSCFPFASEAIRTIYEVTPEQVRDDAQCVIERIHPDDLARVLASIEHSARTLEDWRLEYRVILPQRGERWLYGQAKPQRLADGSVAWYGFISDVTERRLYQNALAESERRFRDMANASPVLIWVSGRDSLCYWFNQVWLDFTGRTLEQEQGNGWAEGVHPDDYARCLEIYQHHFAARQRFEMEYRLRRHDGVYRWMLDIGVPYFSSDGEFQGFIGSLIDISERKASEMALQHARQLAEQASRAKSVFLANMSHEIRTPMNAILGFAQLALQDCHSSAICDYLHKIHDTGNMLLGILNDILDYSKIEAGRIHLSCSDFSLRQLLNTLHDLFSLTAQEKHLAWRLYIAEGVPDRLYADSLRLQQILTNLLSNAFKFTLQGQVTLGVEELRRFDRRTRLRFYVEDSGIGMSEAERQRLFQPFTQADESISRRFGGTGLGLVITQQLLQLMGSRCQVHSAPGQGSRFEFTLDLDLANTAQEPAAPQATRAAGTGQLAGLRVLVVEDNALNQQLISEWLKRQGCCVQQAPNGLAALESYAAAAPDLILMDIQMPVLDGLETTRRLRQQGVNVPIIALSAGVTFEEQSQCQAAGMNDFVAKPIRFDTLLATLQHWQQHIHNEKTMTVSFSSASDATPTATAETSATAWQDWLDIRHLQTLFSGTPELLQELFGLFTADFASFLEVLQQTLANAAYVEAAKHVHRLKGAAGNIGANRLHQACIELETVLKADRAPSPAQIEQFTQSFNHTLQACRDYLAAPTASLASG